MAAGYSGKPPSSDGPAKPSAGQRGHKGATLSQTERPDRTQTNLSESCADCGSELTADDIEGEPQRRQVFDLPPPRPWEVAEH